MKITTIIYDMDGLLINSEPIWKKAEIEIFGKVNIHLTEELCAQTMGFRIDEVIDFWFQKYPWTNYTKLEIETQIVDRVIELILENDIVLPGVSKSIQYFKSKGFNLAIASSSYMRIIEAAVDKINHKTDFDLLHSAEFEEYGKPHPSVYIYVANYFNVSVESCIVLEDSFYGMISGIAAKMKVIAIPEKMDNKFLCADLILNSLEEIEKAECLF